MYNVSQDYINALDKPINDYRLKLKIAGTNYDESVVVQNTFSITNQCSEGDEVKIGSVYTAQLKMTLRSGLIPRNTWEGVQISAEEGMNISNQTPSYEYVPLGVFYVAEANHTDEGVQITAYDGMLKFDKAWNISTTIGTPFSILKMLCTDCRVQLGMTQAEVEALTNGTEALALYSENDCETYRDVLFWLCQTLASFATMGRDGKLYLRQYTDTTTDTIDETMRFEGSSFSDFVTEYTGIAYTDAQSEEYKYYHLDNDNKLTYNLGTNPFLQYGTETTKKQRCMAILNALQKIHYTPFQTQYLNTPAYDLGDIIVNDGGIGDGAVGCIMYYEYVFSVGYKVEGFGANPALATARNKTDKDIAGLMSKTDKNGIQMYTFKNAESVTINDNEEQELIYIRFATMEARMVTFQAEILADADATLEEIEAKVKYYFDGAEVLDYQPTETWSEDGKHIINLYYVIDVEPNTLYRWQVILEALGGTITVDQGHARGTIWGQGLVAVGAWDGYIDAEDTIGLIDITDSIEIIPFEDDVTVATYLPIDIGAEDTIGLIDITDSIEVEPFTDIMILNKTSIYYDGMTWGDVYEYTWGSLYDEHTW